ncbi:hypothetical protein CHH83_11425 [Bacillus sp. 7586-K]|uniref:Catalase n=1 Tax=Metabacillus niabensis TaxID=324854 RepID=A0ABT9Z2H4_9BACI|nr:hypothetical protein [Metabacillus niabensis]MDQ0226451.1 hypothetical protein [Metabacillus niabensis]PAD68862.1 hypothetical protein CHH83_11425 [Bacillus sp. 7586-K]
MDRDVTPHFDGEKESIINDPLSTESTQMGVEVTADPEFSDEKNPFHHPFHQNKSMASFEKLTRGKKIEK